LKARELVLIHISSIERTESTPIKIVVPRRISETCPWLAAYKQLPAHLQCIIGPCPPPPIIFDNIPSDIKLHTASDGSVENENGYHGCIIARMDNTTIIEGYEPTDGRIEDTTSYTTSYRTEVCGTIALLAFYGMIQSVYKWNASTIAHVCDS
jgi:hypothetical protein